MTICEQLDVNMTIKKELLEIMACPKCKNSITEKEMFLVCDRCQLAYPIFENEIPDFLLEDALELEKAEKVNFKHNFKKD